MIRVQQTEKPFCDRQWSCVLSMLQCNRHDSVFLRKSREFESFLNYRCVSSFLSIVFIFLPTCLRRSLYSQCLGQHWMAQKKSYALKSERFATESCVFASIIKSGQKLFFFERQRKLIESLREN